MELPQNLRYSKEHEWIELIDDGKTAKIGITEYAQEKLGDVVHIELPEEGDSFKAQESFGSVESVKAVSDVYTPVDGAIKEVNETLLDTPELINDDPYGEGWMILVEVSDASGLEKLMNADDYQAFLEDDDS
jgi:glycine cleavage system H protein